MNGDPAQATPRPPATQLPTSLSTLFDATVAGLGPVERATEGSAVVVRWEGRIFAALDGDRIEVDLGTTVGEAARRTPDATDSSRGPDWVTFQPTLLDRYAVDRAVAWIEHAWRRAAG